MPANSHASPFPPDVTLISIVRDGLLPWKCLERMLQRTRPFVREQIVLIDDRTVDDTEKVARQYADRVEPISLGGPAAEWGIGRANQMSSCPMVMWAADDELPSWRFLRALPHLDRSRRHAVRLLWLVPDPGWGSAAVLRVRDPHYVLWPKGARQDTRIHATVDGCEPQIHDGLFYWHTASLAPLASRLRKVADYAEVGAGHQGFDRYLWDVMKTPVVSPLGARRSWSA